MNQGRTASENVTCVRWFSAQGQVELLDIRGIAQVSLQWEVCASGVK